MTSDREKINVFVVDDSLAGRALLVHILGQDPRLHVLGTTAGNGALAAFQAVRPDVIVLGINAADDRGFATIRSIMENLPVPIVVTAPAALAAGADVVRNALEAGAVTMVARPEGPEDRDYVARALAVAQTAALMAEVKVVKRWPRSRHAPPPAVEPAHPKRVGGRIDLVVIGASTGGPPVLQTLLSGLPTGFPVPVLVVQHIATGFVPGLATWLRQRTGRPVEVAGDGQMTRPGHVYLAPDDRHMGVDGAGRIRLADTPPEHGLRPSVAHLFRSVAESFGARCAAVLLTGMGKDGARELKALRDIGAMTITQDADSCVVNGMPGEAARLGAATHILPPDGMPAVLARLVSAESRGDRNRTPE